MIRRTLISQGEVRPGVVQAAYWRSEDVWSCDEHEHIEVWTFGSSASRLACGRPLVTAEVSG